MEVRLVARDEVQEVADRLRRVDRRLAVQLRGALRRAARRGVKRAKAEARGLPAKGAPGGTLQHPHRARQLRRTVARGVRAQVRAGGARMPTARIITSMPDESQAALPLGLDSGPRGWRHPVFGDRDVWVRQPGFSWFREPLAEEAPAIADDMRQVLGDTAQWIADAGA